MSSDTEAAPATTASPSPGGRQPRRLSPFAKVGSRYSWGAMLFYWLLFAFNSNFRGWATGILSPAIVDEFHINAATLGWFGGGTSVAVGVLAIPLSVWTDKGGHGWSRKYRYLPIVVAYIGLTLLTGVHFLTASFIALFIIQFLAKAFSGAGEMSEVTGVGEWWPVERRGFALGLQHTAAPWGTFLGGLLVSFLLGVFGPEHWRSVFLLVPLATIPLLIAYWLYSRRGTYERFEKGALERAQTLPIAVVQDAASVSAPKGALGRALKNPNVVVTSAVFGVAIMVYLGINSWLPLYLSFVAHYSLASTAILSLLYLITAGFGQIVWGAISDRFGRKGTLVFLFVWMAVGLVMLQFVGLGVVGLISTQLLLGVATNAVYPILYAMAADSIEPGANGIAIGLNVAAQALGGVGPLAVGLFIQAGGGFHSATGYIWALVAMGIAMLACAAAILFFTRETLGWFKKHDRALVSRSATLKNVAINEATGVLGD